MADRQKKVWMVIVVLSTIIVYVLGAAFLIWKMFTAGEGGGLGFFLTWMWWSFACWVLYAIELLIFWKHFSRRQKTNFCILLIGAAMYLIPYFILTYVR